MIASFRCHKTESLFAGVCPNFFRTFRTLAERKLQMLDSATEVQDRIAVRQEIDLKNCGVTVLNLGVSELTISGESALVGETEKN